MQNQDLTWTRSLPFDKTKQDAILGHLITNYSFFMQARGTVKPEWFLETLNQKIWRTTVKFYNEYNSVPTQNELMDYGEIRIEEPNVKSAIKTRIMACINQIQFYTLPPLKQELTAWMHASIYWQNVHESIHLFNKEHFKDAFFALKKTTKAIDEISFENNMEADFSNYQADMQSTEVDLATALTFGNPAIDKLLAPEVDDPTKIKGGLFRKDTTVLLAPSNIGKSACCISVLRHNLRMGKSVLFLTHEGRESDIKQKIWCALLKCQKKDLAAMCLTKQGQEMLEKALQVMRNQLTYIPLVKAGLTVEEVESVIRRKVDEKIARTGTGYDLLIDDYPAILTSQTARKGELNKRHIDGLVYGYFVALADELNAHSLVPIQTNRAGSKVNKQQGDENRLLTMEDVAESWDVMCRATNVITLNRSEEDKYNKRITYYIDKSRSNETGWAVVSETAYHQSLTHAPWLPHTYYRGSDNLGSKLYDLITQNNGNQIPHELLKDLQNAN